MRWFGFGLSVYGFVICQFSYVSREGTFLDAIIGLSCICLGFLAFHANAHIAF